MLIILYFDEEYCITAVKMGGTAEVKAFRPNRDERLFCIKK